MTRRQFGLLSGAAATGALATPASPAGVKKLKITRVRTVEVRDIVTGHTAWCFPGTRRRSRRTRAIT
ncbi:MAG TPA: hypothetical protein VE959_28420 [Bryobacteraceae bacterium]|nr:hypothetical protein [Bryobacteraceae bacterium]